MLKYYYYRGRIAFDVTDSIYEIATNRFDVDLKKKSIYILLTI